MNASAHLTTTLRPKVFLTRFLLSLSRPVTFFVGENGSGKSTVLEGIAEAAGFNPLGGNANHRYGATPASSRFVNDLRLTWIKKTHEGFFLRAESFYTFASYIDNLADDSGSALLPYGGRSLHSYSHGESFLALFSNKFRRGLFLLDEPEAALSPSRQLSLLLLINGLVKTGTAQFIIATHSPILFSYPDAMVLEFSERSISPISFSDTEHYKLLHNFLMNPHRFHKQLFSEDH